MPNIQIYFVKRSFDVQKAERFFKERRVPFQAVDMKRHAPGKREMELFARAAGGVRALIDQGNPKAASAPAAYYHEDSAVLEALMEDPSLMVAPIVRNGQKVAIGVREDVWAGWLDA